MEKYIGEKKILGVVEIALESDQTPSGNIMVSVNFEDGTKETMPKNRFEMIVTDQVSDASTVQMILRNRVGSLVYAMLHEYGVLYGEAEEILNSVSTLVNNGYEKARDIKWGYEHRLLPLNETNKVLKEYNAKQNSNGTASSGSGSN